jgi:S-DNA-T family DNA segregation ATPase FtsK/SpoIIIE
VVVLVESDAPIDRSRLVAIAERAKRARIVLIWIADAQTLLPSACQTFLVVGDDPSSLVGYVHEGESVAPVEVDRVSYEEATAAARQLAPVVDSGCRSTTRATCRALCRS